MLFAPDPGTLASLVQGLLQDQPRRLALAERGARLARPLASQDIARGLLERAS